MGDGGAASVADTAAADTAAVAATSAGAASFDPPRAVAISIAC